MTITKLLYTKLEAAASLGLNFQTIDRARKAGKIRPTLIGRRVLYPAHELERYADACRKVSRRG